MNTLLTTLLAFTFATSVHSQQDSCTADIATVARHEGETVTFCGTPSEVKAPDHAKGDPIFLDFGGRYPNSTFNVIIWGEVSGKDREKLVEEFRGKALRIHGKVTVRDGKPTLTVEALADITVVK